MKKQIAGIFILAAASLAATVQASVVESGLPEPAAILSPFTYTGTTAGGPTFDRPNASGTSAPTTVSATATAVPYDLVIFSVATSGTYSFLSTSTTAGYDNYTFLYSGYFTGSPLSGVLIGNDNLTAGSTMISGFTYNLTPGTMYTFLTTGLTNTSAGSFTDTITLAAVPEPGTWVIIGASVVGLASAQRFRRRST